MLRTPPHILVTTPESLYLLLTAERSREMLRTVRTVIVDEIHAVIGTRRGAHLALSLERLGTCARAAAAAHRPVRDAEADRRGRALPGRRAAASPARSSTSGIAARWISAIEMPGSPLEAVMSHEVWEEFYDRLAELDQRAPDDAVFVNTRRLAERLARHLTERLGEDAVTAHHGSLSKEMRLDAETPAEGRRAEGARRHRLARARHRHRPRRSRLPDRLAAPDRDAAAARRPLRPHHRAARRKGGVFPVSRDELVECAALLRSVRRGELDRDRRARAPLDVLAQQIVAETACRGVHAKTSSSTSCAARGPIAT